MTPLPKPSRTDRKLEERKRKLARGRHEDEQKALVRRRDRVCRFPLCGCRRLGLRLEVSHQVHKGAGGNPSGDRSLAKDMVLLCVHRHQDGAISRHKGTLRARPLTRAGFDGPVAWLVDLHAGDGLDERWTEVAREVRPGVLEPLTPLQQHRLEVLAEMTR